jgi:DNA-binding NarL/FixJ family response regulator
MVVLCHDLDVACTVLIVDDHAGFRSFARGLLQGDVFDVVGEAADGESAMIAVARLLPQLVLLDIQLPDLDGFEVARRLAQWPSGPAVVLISSRDASSYRRRLIDTPARGFMTKSGLSAAALAPLVA